MGVEHFSALGAEVEPVLVRDRFDADDAAHVQAIGEADLIYLSGGKPGHLIGDARAGRAVGRGAGRGPRARRGARRLLGRGDDPRRRDTGRLPPPAAVLAAPLARRASGWSPGATVIPHYDAFPEALAALLVLQAPRGIVVLGIDEETAVVGRDGSWQVHGRSGSRSGAAAAASASERATSSGSEARPGRSCGLPHHDSVPKLSDGTRGSQVRGFPNHRESRREVVNRFRSTRKRGL